MINCSIKIFILLFFLAKVCTAQDSINDKTQKDEIVYVVDKKPKYPGGLKKLSQFIIENYVYPAQANEKGIEGVIYVSIEIASDGKVENAKVVKDLGDNTGEEALRVASIMPNWTPAVKKGKNVRSITYFPIKLAFD